MVDARDVVLDREHAALGLGARLHVPRDLVARREEARVLDLREETLEGDAVDAGLLHPREVARDGLRVVRRVEPRDRAVGVREVGRNELVGAELGGVGPLIDRQVRGGRRVVAEPVRPPVHRRAVAAAQEPALISEQHLAFEASWRRRPPRARRCGRLAAPRSGPAPSPEPGAQPAPPIAETSRMGARLADGSFKCSCWNRPEPARAGPDRRTAPARPRARAHRAARPRRRPARGR